MIYSVDDDGNLKCCRSDCKLSHEHYVGSYESALKYFGCIPEDERGNLLHIVVAHQTMPQFTPKLSNELYDLLMNAMSRERFWTSPQKRHDRAMKAIEDGQKLGIVNDEPLLKKLQSSKRKTAQNRIWQHEKWLKSL